MLVANDIDLRCMQQISQVVGETLKQMREYAKPGMSTKELDEFGGALLTQYGAKSAPKLTYGFPGWTCISVNHEIAHGIPSERTVLKEGDLVNIDVSAELNGFWSDNGGSFILGTDTQNLLPLVNASKDILRTAIQNIRGGIRIADIGKLIDKEAKRRGYKVILNLTGHGVGHSLHEEPEEIPNWYDKSNTGRFRKNSVVAIETFISTQSTFADTLPDGWTLVGDCGGFVAQHEHTILVTDSVPVILTACNNIWE